MDARMRSREYLGLFTELRIGHEFERPITILGVISIVDDDESVRGASKRLLRSAGYEVKTFASAESFLDSNALRETDCLILDVRLPGMDGLELQRRLNTVEFRIPIIFVTAHDDQTNRRKAIEAGAVEFFRKPFDGNALVSAIQASLKARDEGRV